MTKAFRNIFIYAALLFLQNNLSAQTQPWIKLQSPVDVTLRYLSFVDSLTGWAAGDSGKIIRTTDGGINWAVQNSTVQTFINDIFFADKNYGWALTLKDVFPFNSVLLRTTDGGDNWLAQDFPDSSELIRTIFFFDSLNGFAGGSYIAYTLDGGNNWVEADIDSGIVSDFPVYKFNFLNNKFGYACGGRIDVAGVVWRTTDSGLNWSAQPISADEVFDVYIIDSLNAITLSGDPELLFPVAKLKTTDAGLTWNYTDLPFFGLSFKIDFRTYNEGWSASGYNFLLTTDRGETWNEFNTPDSAAVYNLQFTDARTGYAVGENGIILKIDPALVGTEDETSPNLDFRLHQNYPNPFNSSTTIRFAVSRPQVITIKVYNILGEVITTLLSEEKKAGIYETEFSASELSSGLYFYQLVSGDFVQTKKMILLK